MDDLDTPMYELESPMATKMMNAVATLSARNGTKFAKTGTVDTPADVRQEELPASDTAWGSQEGPSVAPGGMLGVYDPGKIQYGVLETPLISFVTKTGLELGISHRRSRTLRST